ncbi:MAG: ATP-dependent DNA helicase RecG [Chloroflexi bacterium]|nr:ATP-dependent DNA helicase RecG [Chloroflexota bacterium]
MSRSFKRLQQVLDLEAKQGYKNKAVVGGIGQFATFWVGQAREEAVDEQDKALVEQVAEVLSGYGRLPGPEARAKAMQDLNTQLRHRADRVGEPTPPPTKKAAKPKPAVAKPKPQKQKQKPPPPKPQPKIVDPDPEGLSQSVTALKGVGPKIGERLAKLGVTTIWDLLYIFPRRYDDYTLMKPINRLEYGEQVTIIGTVWEARSRRTRNNQVIVQAIISDGTGKVQATWFNQPWLTNQLKAGLQIVISGKVDQFLGRPIFNSPDWEPLELEPLKTRRIVPVYPLTKGLTSNKMREIMQTAVKEWSPRLPDPLPQPVRKRLKLNRLPVASQKTHFPDNQQQLHKARRRLAFDELFLLQLGMQGSRHEWQSQTGLKVSPDPAVMVRFRNALPFELTAAQQRVIDEIMADMATGIPMNRLLQGDVGAGKTLVAAAAMLSAASTGQQAALMAPTEILAEQHYQSLSKLLTQFGVTVSLLTGSTPTTAREQIYAGLADGSIHIAIGTHALIQGTVNFGSLALAVVDEQHRFGVDQRQALRDKGTANGEVFNPHLLTMSATPIPRTLALSLYGDLDLSIIDEMPPGRQEIKTRWLPGRERERAYSFIRSQVKQGRQAYIIYPLVEESDKVDAKAAVEDHRRLQEEVFPDLQVGLIHGRLKSNEKESVMRHFYEGEVQILTSTSVIEVGVDVPNATVMLIEGANRFGLAQLHQFRGRVGRGKHQSYCMLIADSESQESEERLSALEETNDGFILAEKDLELRGPGEFFGRRQSGLPELQMASLLDMDMLELARKEAIAIFEKDPTLELPEHKLLRDRVSHFWQAAGDFS